VPPLTNGRNRGENPGVRPSPDRHQRLRAVFDEVLLLDPAARESHLNRTCGDDPALRSDVIRLLAAHDRADSFLEHPINLWSTDREQAEFAGTDRFRIVRRLGTGGMGVVYEVHDNIRGDIVALKTLRRSSAADLYRLKQEFRSLADVTHPNLVCLYELFVEDDQCFFTMELVRGVSFVDYARADNGRLVHALRQLIEGVSALHRRGKLHRDIKPSNVLVTPEGRVVILDFGLIAEALPRHAGLGNDARYVRAGTPAYMSPEEASGGMPSEASDWYGVGVTLYEALTGSVPFDGAVPDVLRQKGTSDPLPPSGDHIPSDLSAICMGLLHRTAEQRLNGSAALTALTRDTAPSMSASPLTAIQDTVFVGREGQLQALRDAIKVPSRGGAMAVAIYGPSGIGKSALVRRFLSEPSRRDQAVVLAGRCYENESVPYKALDGVVDDLSHYLGSIPFEDVQSLLPPDMSALTRVFPVLLQVDAVADACQEVESEGIDPLRVRRRAFEALAALLRRLATRRSLVIWIDDLQWADADSTVLLEEILGPPSPPAMLTLLCFRSEEVANKPFLRALLDRADQPEWSALSLEPMTEEEARTLIGGLLPGGSALTDLDRMQLTREAGGSPFVLEQLALHASVTDRAVSQPPTFAAMFDARLGALRQDARGFLETLAICGRPMAPELVCDACGIARDRQSLVVTLRASRLIRSSGSSARVETYHDRIREVLAERLEPGEVRRIHGRMLTSLLTQRSEDCEALFEHSRGAGDTEKAAGYAALAAEKAVTALAFDRAASFYRHALELLPSSSSGHAWREELATALANAGRPAEAADAYLRAAAGAEHARRVELQRRAAEQFLTGGHIDRGLDLIRRVIESVGLSVAGSPRTAMARLLWRRARLKWRGLQFVTRRSQDIDPPVLLRLDTCWSAATGLALVDIINASDFVARHLHLALDAGEPSRIARGLALESAARNADWPFRKGSARLVQRSADVARSVDTPQALAMDLLADGITAIAIGKWQRSLSASERALAILRDQCVGVTWEMNIAQNIVIGALMYLGELGEVSRRVPPLLADARRRGNLYLATELCTRSNYAWLALDEPDEGERETQEALTHWSQKGFHRQHYSALIARGQTALYRGDAEAAWTLLVDQQSKLRQSMLTRVQMIRVESLYLRARIALAMASANRSRHRFLSMAGTCARRIAAEQMPWSDPIALLVRAGIASLEGNQTAALRSLHAAVDRFDRADMKLYAAVARRRIGALQPDDHGRELQHQAEAWMAAQPIRNPVCMTRMLAPGFPD
jgi:tetratricopeptide (TPR) repeat protein